MAKDIDKTNVQKPKKERTSVLEYFRGVRTEMKKVVWPTKKELGSYTAVVLVVCAFFALAFWAVDSGFLALLKAVLNIEL
ncbi:MAG: preprotein translocase subunit SecE [Clostridiales bacterium]|nr:preprotein translocase subunit SecE [Clostridiales bacterium]MDD6390505.1 preprotein translocase subunit SecE [Bacillota bacterium]